MELKKKMGCRESYHSFQDFHLPPLILEALINLPSVGAGQQCVLTGLETEKHQRVNGFLSKYFLKNFNRDKMLSLQCSFNQAL